MKIVNELEEHLKQAYARSSNRKCLDGKVLDLNSKNLMIHADDLGFHTSVNLAFFRAINKGLITSGSIMATCSGFDEIADFSEKNKDLDLGIHLTLTSEWPNYRWGPISPLNSVSSLIDSDGYFFSSKEELLKNFIPSDIEHEFESQINFVLKRGIRITHIDSHMFVALSHPTIQKIYMELGRKYNLPVLIGLNKPLKYLAAYNKIIMNKIYIASSKQNARTLKQFYVDQIKSITPGLNILLIHPACDDPELRKNIGLETAFGSNWRLTDFEYFTSDEFQDLIKKMNIKLFSWKDIYH